ncbi:hypothetical protein M404DRAFT_1000375 [Pisolithus tinctorius Marx 270]|uniref:Secreted protein n=1 Tax=Pisolithus tinctorius Marx 270 TaxID=870435 RepID=A0A0C3PAE9_PISTI|nr:hypothetical protein M404DRAFT_1000375 [Pisolithus tinctorius Marx 270]
MWVLDVLMLLTCLTGAAKWSSTVKQTYDLLMMLREVCIDVGRRSGGPDAYEQTGDVECTLPWNWRGQLRRWRVVLYESRSTSQGAYYGASVLL